MNKFLQQKAACSCLFLIITLLFTSANIQANVCQEGLGSPPNLASGVSPNLLLLLDNSGSMLDLGYVATVGECVDNGYDATKTYAGLFNADKWYKWVPGTTTPQWTSGTTYSTGDYVYSEGIFYKATAATGSPSTGADINSDTEVTWKSVYYIQPWTNGTAYPANSFVRYENQLYYSAAGGTANDSNASDGISIDGDSSVTWQSVDSTWLNNTPYAAGAIVSDHGMLYRSTTSGSSSGTGVSDDTGIVWSRLDEGFFLETTYTSVSDAQSNLSSLAGSAYKNNDLYIHITEVSGAQSGVPAFAARGNLLNWASASKFDIQKKILTGGKYHDSQDVLVSEGRGCSSHGFIKEVKVNNDSSVITFSIRGFNDDDWIDTKDDTTRIAILGVSTSGFIGSARQQACQNAINEVAKGDNWNQGASKQYISDCLAYTGANNIIADSNAAYNHSIHECWSIVTKPYTTPSELGQVSQIINACQKIYDNGVNPPTIDPSDSGYMCYGAYNSTIPDANATTGTGSSREGYIGRCWEPGNLPAGCEAVSCSSNFDTGDPRCFSSDNHLYDCTGNITGQGECNKPWKLRLQDADPNDGIICDTSASAAAGGWTNDNNPNTAEECIQEALWDYCGSLRIPEVIDPSDQIFNTGDTWGMPGALIDSGIVSMFGTDRPLIVMKGFIKQTTAPEGLLHEVADRIRIGVMAFNDNGALTECQNTVANDTIENYCPNTNKDGAKVISPIKAGDEATANGTHLDDLVQAINKTPATAWTPLAEAMYDALGYYGQKSAMRLSAEDFSTALEGTGWEDPVQYWCQDNYILVITEGSSTADININVKNFVTSMGLEDGTVLAANEGECLSNGQSDLFGSTFLDDLAYFGQNAPVNSLYATPAATPGQIASVDDGTLHDKQNVTTYMVVTGKPRDDGTTTDECNPATIMENAAKNGGTSLIYGEDPAQLETNLRAALSDILFRASSGSAASVISNQRNGEGGVYQALYWPKIDRGLDKEPLTWVGNVHAFFIDEHGYFWDDYSGNSSSTKGRLWTEDKNGNGILDPGEDVYPLDASGNPAPNGKLDGDRRIVTYHNISSNSTEICFNPSVGQTLVCQPSDYYNTSTSVSLRDFDAYLWSAKDRLESVSDNDISTNRGIVNGKWDFSGGSPSRFIFTWNDLNNDGIVDSDFNGDGSVDRNASNLEEIRPVTIDDPSDSTDDTSQLYYPAMDSYTSSKNRSTVLADFNVSTPAELDSLIQWLRGYDEFEPVIDAAFTPYDPLEDLNNNGIRDTVLKCRQFPDCDYSTINRKTWRLGDVIDSTPTVVSRPAEGFHLVYQDPSYARFYKKYLDRRNVIYFGGNDGMLHAVNGGFYQSGLNKFLPCRADQRNSTTNECMQSTPYAGSASLAYPALGDELWAYIPYNLQPHLKCLTDPAYDHKYFVDATPRIFDVRIFSDDSVHPGGWGTVLVGYMRFGGAPQVADNTLVPTENREFISSYFILDITDPERPPTLIAEMTMTTEKENYDGVGDAEDKYTRLGYTTSMPSVVVMRNELGNSEWFLVLGNGPTTIKGQNNQRGKIAIVPLNSLTGVNWTVNGDGSYDPSDIKPFRIPNEEPTTTSTIPNTGRKLIPNDRNGVEESFVGDTVPVDYGLSSAVSSSVGIAYKTDAVYFGTTDGSSFGVNGGKTYWNGDGRMFRLVTYDVDTTTGKQLYSYPGDWDIRKLIDAEGPIKSAPNISFDPENFWIYFGTGRYYAAEDKTDDSTQYFFGLREPRDTNCNLTWGEIQWLNAGGSPIATNPALAQGFQGLLRTDPVHVINRATSPIFTVVGDYVYCEDESGTACTLPLSALDQNDVDTIRTYYRFHDLEQYVKGENCGSTNNSSIGIDGWYRHLYTPRERSLEMPPILGGLITNTTYVPYADMCQTEGRSYIYDLYYLTGTAWYQDVFGTYTNLEGKTIVRDRYDLGVGQASAASLQVGSGGPNEVNAYVQLSNGDVIQIGQKNLPLSTFKSGRTSWRNK